MTRYFEYGDGEVEYLKSRDKKLAAAIEAVGHVYREMEGEDLFAGVVHHIVAQQISTAAQATVWARLQANLGQVAPATVSAATAEMLLLFNLGRPDILSFGDLGIHRGMRMVYHHRKVTRQMFERYRRRYSPYGSVASLYLWAISHMDVPGYDRDYAPKSKSK